MNRALAAVRAELKRTWLLAYRRRRVRLLMLGIAVLVLPSSLIFLLAAVVMGAEYLMLRAGVPIFIMLFLSAVLVTDLVLRLRRRTRSTREASGLETEEQPLSLLWWALAAALWVVVLVSNVLLPVLQ